ncbi:MAG: serine/threonine protein kinase [Muribaculaceae bacterium]|nr:serine/threonine protein kinase [Muribaculaceae bacterium]
MANNTLKTGTLLKNGQFGQYVIVRHLASGGFGNTYLAQRAADKIQVAVKEFFMSGVNEREETTSRVTVSNADSEPMFRAQLDKFKKEAGRVAIMRNQHIVRLYDYFEENDTAYYVMEYVDGQSLSERLKMLNHPLPENEVTNYFMQVLEALAEVHGKRIWHLDIKPGNILVTKTGVAKLIDFGASKQLNMAGQVTRSAMCYTPGYAPVEQVAEEMQKFGPWTDFYALGATLYNLLTGFKPPSSSDITERGMAAFQFPPALSPRMKNMIFWLMRPNRGERPQSVAHVMQAWQSGMQRQPQQQQMPQRQPQQHQQRRAVMTPVTGRPSQPQSRGYAPQPQAPKNSNKTLYIVLGIVGAILLGLIGLFAIGMCADSAVTEPSSSVSTDYGFSMNDDDDDGGDDSGTTAAHDENDDINAYDAPPADERNLVNEVNAMRNSGDGGNRTALSGKVGISTVASSNHFTMYSSDTSPTCYFYGTYSYKNEEGSYALYAKADIESGKFLAEDYAADGQRIGEYSGICEANGTTLTARGRHSLPDGDTEEFKLVFNIN